ncbi:hypothetical protein CONPUDRAFT_134147 [Coniophora puteana RWD-64-598 SS2]|uniref:Uncharacterized protein n=1 Tax=Coniophora puteana (strain RWD-64-598) TaxID=741705 RepID=A0A5M3N7F8_CONPW|nr:uncharacterized protein CONPUDRAFT_134147 [Coniophora puteana RWD-64-598 SS2]EIW86791.1 hypothetical protein CONPUDRAFT_134147 [Coniophora puteana RWD-64-598 SS2]
MADNVRAEEDQNSEKQCRICLDGDDPSLGRLIRPCLCKGSISYVHVQCLQTWRRASPSASAFFQCPQCQYRYRLSRTGAVGLATNPVVLGLLSSILFTALVMTSSYLTTSFFHVFDNDYDDYSYGFSYTSWYYAPYDAAHDIVRAAFRILKDQDVLEDDSPFTARPLNPTLKPQAKSGLVQRFIGRFITGLPLVGAGSLIQMIFSMPFLGPIQWIARYRGSRRRSGNSADIAALVIIFLLAVGLTRALVKVYELTRKLSARILVFAEDVILEVN